jgi:hypothetical protein
MSASVDNLFARDGFYWWVGVVEDRMDPLKLGRCRVRILGYHVDNKRALPTEDLPWAMPMQPIFSAAISGKGQTPLGPLEGTWIVGFFADGKDMQQPIMMGTMGGIPSSSTTCTAQSTAENNNANAQRDNQGNIIYDERGNSIPVMPAATIPGATASGSITGTLPPLNQAKLQSLMDAIAFRESSSIAGGIQNYYTINRDGYVGKYQFGADALITHGYVKPPADSKTIINNSYLNDSRNWSGKSDVNNVDDFLSNKNNVQENAMYENLSFNYEQLKKKGAFDASLSSDHAVAGYLAAAHIAGAGGANQLRLGKNVSDNLGTSAGDYYALGAQSQGGTADTPVAVAPRNSAQSGLNTALNLLRTAAGALNNPKLGQPEAYEDPNGVYPRCAYVQRQDTNKLATNNDNLETTPKPAKEQTRIDSVITANGAGGNWTEPPSAFAARYPYNHVKETESGHVVEFDDTPNAERIHIYHRTGTYVEIDREGSVSYKVMGENYNIYSRNNRVYTQGNMDVTVDGAKTLLVKNTLDVEVVGKTTINLKDDADINVSKDLRIKAKNIYMEAQQDINITAGNYVSHKVGGDLSYTVAGDEQHRVSGSIDMDAADINLNSGTANPFDAADTGLDTGVLGAVTKSGFEATGLNPLPVGIANPETSIGKGMSGLLGGFGTGGFGLLGNALSNPAIANAVAGLSQGIGILNSGTLQSTLGSFGGGGVGGILAAGGVDGLNSVLSAAGLGGGISTLVANATANPAIRDAISAFGNLDQYINTNGLGNLNQQLGNLGLGNLDKIVSDAGLNLSSLVASSQSVAQNGILNAIKSSGLLPKEAIVAGENIINDFYKYGASNIDINLPKVVSRITCDATEFANWTDFPEAAQLSKYFNLGDVTSRVTDVASQFRIQDQASLTRYDIISNLKSLSVNVLDPLYEQYPNLQISNGFKPVASYFETLDENNPYIDLIAAVKANVGADAAESVQQQLDTATPFERGQAVNLHFKGAAASDYYNIARWVKDNIAFDQLRLEYSTFGDQEPWITATYNTAINRSPDAFDKVVTCVNGQVVCNYLADLTTT